jgi:hypothetical protein
MTVKETLKRCLLQYPSIFPNKWAVYHQWFIVNGNGYEWKNGQLISIDDKQCKNISDAIEKHFEFYLSEHSLLTSPLKHTIKSCKKNILDSLNWKERAKDFSKQREELYPLCQYAKILNTPEDIKADWKEAAQEMYEWLAINYNDLKESDQKWIDKIKL